MAIGLIHIHFLSNRVYEVDLSSGIREKPDLSVFKQLAKKAAIIIEHFPSDAIQI